MATARSSISTGWLIAWPALITLAITILRMVGELQHWPKPWFDLRGFHYGHTSAGGDIIGLSWLPIIFGPYFAWKLAQAAEGPLGAGRAIGAAVGGVVLFCAGWFTTFMSSMSIKLMSNIRTGFTRDSILLLIGLLVTLVAGFVTRIGWRELGNTLFAYALAARIPVIIVMFIARSVNGGRGWGRHYDAVPPGKFVMFDVLPQLTLWLGWTVAIGGLLGAVTVALFHRRRQAASVA